MLEEKKEVIGIDTCMAESRMSSGAECEKKRGKRQDPAAARKERQDLSNLGLDCGFIAH